MPDWPEFFKSGALFRWNQGDILLFRGLTAGGSEISSDVPHLFLAPFFAGSQQLDVYQSKAWGIFPVEAVRDWLRQISIQPIERTWVEPSRESFGCYFSQIAREFERGSLKKVVPIVEATAPQGLSSEELRQALLTALSEDHLVAYGFWRDGEGLVGASPEFLWQQSGQSVRSMALAGTRPKDRYRVGELLEDPKERHEHQLVIEDLRERLSAFGSVSVGETVEHDVGALVHLKTDIEVAGSAPLSVVAAVNALHPTPALGGEPRELARELLLQQSEAKRRGLFGGPFGVQLSSSEVKCLVAIRNITWSKERISLFTGCGVVPQSEVEREWSELKAKRKAVQRSLGFKDAD